MPRCSSLEFVVLSTLLVEGVGGCVSASNAMALPTRGEAARLHIFRFDQHQDSGTARRTGSKEKELPSSQWQHSKEFRRAAAMGNSRSSSACLCGESSAASGMEPGATTLPGMAPPVRPPRRSQDDLRTPLTPSSSSSRSRTPPPAEAPAEEVSEAEIAAAQGDAEEGASAQRAAERAALQREHHVRSDSMPWPLTRFTLFFFAERADRAAGCSEDEA